MGAIPNHREKIVMTMILKGHPRRNHSRLEYDVVLMRILAMTVQLLANVPPMLQRMMMQPYNVIKMGVDFAQKMSY